MNPIIKTIGKKSLFCCLFSFFFFLNVNAQYVSTLAGSTIGFADGIGTAAQFYNPYGVAVDAAGNVYVADSYNHRIRKITTTGAVTTFAGSATWGSADGTGAAAQFYRPSGLAMDTAGNLFLAEFANNRIRKITAAGVVSTVAGSTQGYADGTGTAAQFNHPMAIAIDAAGNLYVADYGNECIRKITNSGVVSTFAGSVLGHADGIGTAAQFYGPSGVAVDGGGNVYVADQANARIRKITAAGVVSTFAGSTSGFADGIGTAAQFQNPAGVAIDAAGNVLVADEDNGVIRRITAAGVVSTLAGSGIRGFADGLGSAAQFYNPVGMAVDASGNIFVTDQGYNRIPKKSLVL